MKNILKTLDDIKYAMEKGPGGETRFLKLDDGEAVTLRFLQELDESGKNYDEERGTAVGIYEHINPDDFHKSFLCSSEDGRCYGCELTAKNRDWRAKGRLLVNVVVRGQKGGGDKVKIFGTSLSKKGLMPTLVEYAEDNSTLMDREYKLKRTGTFRDTSYTLLPREVSAPKKSDESVEVHSLEDSFRNLSYDEQVELVDSEKSDW